MSFDVFLARFVHGESAEVDRTQVREVLSARRYRGPDQFGFYVVAFPDGTDVEFSAKGLELDASFTGCAFHMRGFGEGLVKFIFDIARGGDMVIIPAMEGNPLILVSEQQRKNIPAELREGFKSVVVDSAGELGAILRGGFGGWSTYRDQILRRSQAEGGT